MTPEQVTRRRARSYALIGCGAAAMLATAQFSNTQSPEGPWSIAVPVIFFVAGLALIGAGLVLLFKTKGQEAAPPPTIQGPQKTTAMILAVVGLAALLGTIAVDYLTPSDDPLWLAVSVGLLVVMGICFIGAGRIVRKAKTAPAK
jgi:FtsH-binding integral membrane protein